ncbi:MAG: ABC transporter ATP-binding protein [Bacteroidota bacterium]
MIKAENIVKTYEKKSIVALNDVSFNVNKGEIFGFVGPDGAGKTSLFRIITTMLLPDSGEMSVMGFNVKKEYSKIRTRIGYMPGRFSLYPDLSVEENLTFFASIFDTTITENYHLIKDIYSQIEPFKNRKAGALSGGMKQKLALSCALIHKPELLILDEPTTGVDAVSRKEFWQMLRNLKDEGITIVVSTPYMDEASLCDRIALIQKGEILAVETPENIVGIFKKQLFGIRTDNIYLLMKDLNAFPDTDSVYPFGQYVHYVNKNKSLSKEELLNYLKSKEHQSIEIKEIQANIEDCFMDLMRNTERTGL